MRIIKSGILYFLFVFGAGFILGPIRMFWLVPHVGTRWAELIEMPIMVIVIIAAARWIIRRLAVSATLPGRLGIGGFALALLLTAEFTVVLWLQGRSLQEYFATRDPVAGTVYYLMLGVFAIMPAIVLRRRNCPSATSA